MFWFCQLLLQLENSLFVFSETFSCKFSSTLSVHSKSVNCRPQQMKNTLRYKRSISKNQPFVEKDLFRLPEKESQDHTL